VWVCNENNVTTAAAIATIGTALGHILLAAQTHAPIATLAASNKDACFINEHLNAISSNQVQKERPEHNGPGRKEFSSGCLLQPLQAVYCGTEGSLGMMSTKRPRKRTVP
jgi:hypothetical protein